MSMLIARVSSQYKMVGIVDVAIHKDRFVKYTITFLTAITNCNIAYFAKGASTSNVCKCVLQCQLTT